MFMSISGDVANKRFHRSVPKCSDILFSCSYQTQHHGLYPPPLPPYVNSWQTLQLIVLSNLSQDFISPFRKSHLIWSHGAVRSSIPRFLPSIRRNGSKVAKIGSGSPFRLVRIVNFEGPVAFIDELLCIDGGSIFLCNVRVNAVNEYGERVIKNTHSRANLQSSSNAWSAKEGFFGMAASCLLPAPSSTQRSTATPRILAVNNRSKITLSRLFLLTRQCGLCGRRGRRASLSTNGVNGPMSQSSGAGRKESG